MKDLGHYWYLCFPPVCGDLSQPSRCVCECEIHSFRPLPAKLSSPLLGLGAMERWCEINKALYPFHTLPFRVVVPVRAATQLNRFITVATTR